MQDLYISDEGKGYPLVLVHGFLSSSLTWEPQIKFLKKYFRVITIDLPGFGSSNKAKSYNSIHAIAKLILACLKAKKIDKFHLLGHSMGGMIVQEMAKISGKKISRLVCYGTGAIGEMPKRFETIDKSRLSLKKNGLEQMAKNIIKTWFVLGESAEYFDVCLRAGTQTSINAADNALVAMKNWHGVANLKSINNKTLIIWGDKDRSYSYEQIKILKNNIVNSELKIFANCAHNVHLEQIDGFNKAVKKFLDSNCND